MQMRYSDEVEFLEGYDDLEPYQLLDIKLGGKIRYIYDVMDANGQIVEREQRWGGPLVYVDKKLRYIKLTKYQPDRPSKRMYWCVQLKNPNRHVRLYHKPREERGEAGMMRQLLKRLETEGLNVILQKDDEEE